MKRQQPPQYSPVLGPGDDGVHKALLQEKFSPLEPLGQFLPGGLLDDLGPAKQIRAPGSARMMSPSMAKLAVTPPVVGLVSTVM